MTITTPDAASETLPPVPEPGQVVEVRGSIWAVGQVREQGLPRSSADDAAPGITHIVQLQSLAEDRLGEELGVIWELEVGHTVAPDQGLPEQITADGFDHPSTLAAFVDAVRWGAVTSADARSYQAPFRSGVNIEAYQLEPLRRALQSPRTNLLLADDVGLGKTIEAGLVVQELLLRHRARSVIIVCPPSLALKWQDEMREKFGLEFVIVNRELMAEVRRSHGLHANPFHLFPRVIVSMAWLPSVRAQRLLRDVYSQASRLNSARRFAFDMLVVDEAHHVAPSSPSAVGAGRGYPVDSQRTVATRALAERCEHRLFLSATPHNGHPESFTALLAMIDDRRFSRAGDIDQQALREVTVRRLKTDLVDKAFLPRKLGRIPFTPSETEQRTFADLDRLLRRSAKANQKGSGSDIVALLLKKRFLSSPWAFALTMGLYRDAGNGGRMTALDDESDYYTEVIGSEQSDEEEGLDDQTETTTLRRGRRSNPLSAANPQELAALSAWGDQYQHRPDSRLEALITFLDAICRPDGRNWTNERVVIFTEYVVTLEWIVAILQQRGYGDVLAAIQGSTPAEDRELIRARFTADPSQEPVRILVATDSAGEGIDLQTYCHRLINYDIPFNPSRLEQRIGRIDRYGQAETPLIYHFVPGQEATTYGADLDFMARIAEKVGTIAQDLGSVNQVIDEQIQQHFSRVERGKGRKTPVDDGNATITRALAGDLELNRQLTDLSRSYADLQAQMHLTPANTRRVVDTALTQTAQPTLIEIGDDRTDAQVFEVPNLGRAWQRTLVGLDTRLRPGELRPITFDADATVGRTDLVHVHLGHPLLQKASRILRGSLFSAESSMNRVTAVVVEDLPQSCVAAVSRLVLVGRGGIRLHEEVFLTGVRIRGQAMAEAKVEALLEAALDDPHLKLADQEIRASLAAAWNRPGSRLRARQLAAMSQRAETRQQAVTEQLQGRRDADIARAREIFAAFRLNLEESHQRLEEQERAEELTLLPDDQQAQRRRDIRAMEDRMSTLSAEEHREIAALEERYADIRPHVAAAAVVFALTPKDASEGGIG